MDWKSALEVGAAILASLGGAGMILLGLSSYLGRIWASRILESDKQKYRTELEQLRSQYQLDVEKNKTVFNRFSESQFNLYNNVWVALCDLEKSANQLWEVATRSYLKDFAVKLENAKYEVRKAALVIEDEHYTQLLELFVQFEQFEFGKSKLLQLRRERNRLESISDENIRQVIDENRTTRESFLALLIDVKYSFTSQIKGDYLNAS